MESSTSKTTMTEALKTSQPSTRPITITPNLVNQTFDITDLRLQVFRQQEQAVSEFFETTHPNQLLFYINGKKSQFLEYQKFQIARCLNARDNTSLMQLQYLFNSLHLIDDLLMAIVSKMPAQRPVAWQLNSQNQNLMNIGTVGVADTAAEYRTIENSVAATVLQFFGVACYQHDRGYFIGHILGYLFCCYYFAHLGINYAIIPLKEQVARDYPSQWLSVPELVRLLQETDESLKTQVYQLAIFCAQISEYAVDKRIEKMLITEVNSFNKQELRDELSQQVQYASVERESLFQPVKPLK